MSTIARLEDRYEFVKNIGKGGEGEVKQYHQRTKGTLVAVKFRKRRDRGRAREVDILQSFPKDRHVVGFIECFDINAQNCAIILEYCPGGDLYDFYRRKVQSDTEFAFSERFMWSVFKQLADALAFLHNFERNGRRTPVIHCDIKPNNVLIRSLGTKGDYSSISITLADFGFARFYDPKETHQRVFGSSSYFPPEMNWQKPNYTPALDIWGMGAVMHFLAHGYLPLEDPEKAVKRIEGPSGPPGVDREKFLSMGYSKDDWYNVNTDRVVVPINLEQDDQTPDSRRKRPTPRYSDALNECFNLPLTIDAQVRPKASVIAKKVKKSGPNFWLSDLLDRLKNSCDKGEEARKDS